MSPQASPPTPLVCFVGYSNAGKTTLVAKVIEHFNRSGLRIGALKHSAHGFQMDREGKDTHRFRQAGAYAIGISSDTERAVITTTESPTSLAELAASLPADLDLIVVEGYRTEGAPAIEVHRGDATLASRGTGFENVMAVVSDQAGSYDVGDPEHALAGIPEQVALLDLDDVAGVCDLMRAHLKLSR